jgi:hypothetical protein
MSTDETQRRWLIAVPPGGGAVISETGSVRSSVPIWFYWAKIAQLQAAMASELQQSDGTVDFASASIAGEIRPKPPAVEPGDWDELLAGLVAVVAAAHAIDGFYGVVSRIIALRFNRAARRRRIIETLKHGFRVGAAAQQHWLPEFDWLFSARDDAVHHQEGFRPVVVQRVTRETIVFGAPEAENFSAENAKRAAGLAFEVIRLCVANPKPVMADWAKSQTDGVMEALGLPVNGLPPGAVSATVGPDRPVPLHPLAAGEPE